MTVTEGKSVQRTFWGVAAFYLLIAFEFFYMASPFAFYFYAVYRPILDFLNRSPQLAWLVGFFMPHVTETSAAIINIHNIAGAVLAVLGLVAFCAGACQVYYHKLTGKGIVTGGVYNFVRNPQYASLIICSFGLLLLWPRYIVLIMFITMLFAYYALARAEEQECAAKFGQAYSEYQNKTGMFFPFRMPVWEHKPALPKFRLLKPLALLMLYIFVLSAGIGMARGINSLVLNSLYAFYTSNSAYVSVNKIEPAKLENIIKIASANAEVQTRLERAGENGQRKFLNYVLPAEWYVPEIPMHGIDDVVCHSSPANYDQNMYKIIFTKADVRANLEVSGKDILANAAGREPLFEVWVDLTEQRVMNIREMPAAIMYQDIPVALY